MYFKPSSKSYTSLFFFTLTTVVTSVLLKTAFGGTIVIHIANSVHDRIEIMNTVFLF